MNIGADLERVLELLAQAAIDAEKIGAVSCEVSLLDPHGAGILYRIVGQSAEFKPAEPEWH